MRAVREREQMTSKIRNAIIYNYQRTQSMDRHKFDRLAYSALYQHILYDCNFHFIIREK